MVVLKLKNHRHTDNLLTHSDPVLTFSKPDLQNSAANYLYHYDRDSYQDTGQRGSSKGRAKASIRRSNAEVNTDYMSGYNDAYGQSYVTAYGQNYGPANEVMGGTILNGLANVLGGNGNNNGGCCDLVVEPLTLLSLMGFIMLATIFLNSQISALASGRRRRRGHGLRSRRTATRWIAMGESVHFSVLAPSSGGLWQFVLVRKKAFSSSDG